MGAETITRRQRRARRHRDYVVYAEASRAATPSAGRATYYTALFRALVEDIEALTPTEPPKEGTNA